MKSAEIRRRFLDYFVQRGHTLVPSAPLLYNDPTLLFVNAGMVPFKPYFTGAEPAPYSRATSSQKVVRTLDIEEVGKTTRHSTFFQMNGNFSFGDYFKAEAISYAWELVTTSVEAGGLGFDPDTIWVTVLHGDDEAAALWAKTAGLPEHRIQRRGLLDNYWHMGIPGPGGPCSEIYVDRGSAYGREGGPVVDEDRFLEIWNLVFMQEELSQVRAKDDFDVLKPLPKPNIDTGMGLERVALMLQGVDNLYEIDEVFPVIARASELSGRRYGAGSSQNSHEDDVRMRVVADHVRAALMLIHDGVSPGNEARGYVLRRILRRVVRSMRLLGVDAPSFSDLFPVSLEAMKGNYPDLVTDFGRIADIAYGEEEAFRHTLTAGTHLFENAAAGIRSTTKQLPGDKAFQLHDTYGFPIELTLEMAAEQGLEVDEAGFRTLMAEQRTRAKADAKAKKGSGVNTEVYARLRAQGETPFLGFETLTQDSAVRAIVENGELREVALAGSDVELVLTETPFYPESGGQSGDHGVIATADGLELEVYDVQRPVKGLVVHKAKIVGGELRTGQIVSAQVDADWRLGACQAHSATHLIHEALHEILGPSALQAGSFNRPGYMRLDFSWNHGVSDEQRAQIESVSNDAIRRDLGVTATLMPLAEARASGATALFGEVYGDVVRVVDMGDGWSRELCAGTHVAQSAQVGLLAVNAESSVGSGVRRIEAFVGMEAFNRLARERALVMGLAETLKVQPDQVTERVARMVAQLKEAEREIASLKSANLLTTVDPIARTARDMWGVSFVGHRADGVAGGDLRTLAIEVRNKLANQPAVVALVGGTADKPALVVATTAGARERGITAGELVRIGSETLGGRGGGKDDLAQGGGTDASKIDDALTAVEHQVGSYATR